MCTPVFAGASLHPKLVQQLYKPGLNKSRVPALLWEGKEGGGSWSRRGCLTDGLRVTQGSEQRVVIRPGHWSQGLACPEQPSLINPLTGALDSEEHQPTQKGRGVNQPSHRPSNQDGRTSTDLSPNQRVSNALLGTLTCKHNTHQCTRTLTQKHTSKQIDLSKV